MIQRECAMGTKDVVGLLADIAGQVESIIGEKGTISVFRYAGKQMGKRLGMAHQGGTEDDARALVSKFFQDKEFMDAVTLEGGRRSIIRLQNWPGTARAWH